MSLEKEVKEEKGNEFREVGEEEKGNKFRRRG